tara:strand:- start:140 stop:469 length:330 start_codon:yes stop_codon:yes gene_type:complete
LLTLFSLKGEILKHLILLFLVLLPLSVANAKVKEYKYPMLNGYRLDRCLTHGKDCDRPAATRFCLTKSFNKAIYFEIDKKIKQTKSLDSKAVCSKKCDAFKTIVCYSDV